MTKQEIFLAKVQKGGRIGIPEQYRERLGLKEGAVVRVTVAVEE